MDNEQLQRLRFDFLHGLRGVLSLTVVLYHLVAGLGIDRSRPAVALLLTPIMHGHLAVPAFLVLSGFLLAMPVVLRGGQLPGGRFDFLRRRAIRILPPYFAAYFLSMVFFLALEWGLDLYGIDPWRKLTRMIARDWTIPSVVSHLLLVHNLDAKWAAGMTGVFWTIACEWQIYLLFALVLTPLWRRYGLWAAVALCVTLAAALTELGARDLIFYQFPWLIPVFAAGMVAAVVVFGSAPLCRSLRTANWGAITLGLVVILCIVVWRLEETVLAREGMRWVAVPYNYLPLRTRWIPDVLAGICVASGIVWLAVGHPSIAASSRSGAVASGLCGILESRGFLSLGLCGYSLYLTHLQWVVLLKWATEALALPPGPRLVTLLALGIPGSLAIAWVFHHWFERPFMTRSTREMFRPGRERH
jgi:peptidoglycan/LPS O-acetylase OafA/YrhL